MEGLKGRREGRILSQYFFKTRITIGVASDRTYHIDLIWAFSFQREVGLTLAGCPRGRISRRRGMAKQVQHGRRVSFQGWHYL